MKRKFDVFSGLSIAFTLWYSIATIVYISNLGSSLPSIIGDNIAKPMIWLATIGGIFSGEAFIIVSAWSPILAVIIGIVGFLKRKVKCKDFIILPCICLVVPLLMVSVSAGAFLGLLFKVMPYASLAALVAWVVVDSILIIKDKKA